MRRQFIIFLSSLLVFASCDKTYHEVFVPDELGVLNKEFIIEAEGGSAEIELLANHKGTVKCLREEDAAWTSFETQNFDGDSKIKVTLSRNSGFQRRSDILIESESRADTVALYQKGLVEEKFYVTAGSMVIYNGTGKANTVMTDINVPLSSISTEIRYASGGEDWIKDCKITEKEFSFKADDNKDEKNRRVAYIVLTHENGWLKKENITIKVIQARSDNFIGNIVTAEELRNMATVDGFTLPEDTMIEGYVASTTEGGNAGELVVEDYLLGAGTIDYTVDQTTTYLENLDGKGGFRLIAENEAENSFTRYSKVCLNIGESVIYKTEDEPVRYTIKNVRSSNIVTSQDGSMTMPVKVKSITELNDDDIYTLVKIENCEIPIRKGPFTPVNEGYTSACNYHRLAKYPTLIRDIKGGSMYMFTNMTCDYRRNGERLPYGSGSITGIIVHEDYKSFEKDGNIGRYQIRHLLREEIDLAKDFKDNFSGLITEFRYAKFPGEFDVTTLPDAILATEGNGELCHTYGEVSNFSPSYFYIGPGGSKYKGYYEAGAGIEFEDGTQYQPWIGTESAQNTDGKGWYKDNLKISWSNKYWWDSTNSRGYCWLAVFSTEGVSSDRVSLQFAMYNNSQSARSPRYWKAQYSLSTTDTSKSSDSEWIDIAEFTVPDVAIWASQNDWQTLGTRVYDFPLPTEILGHKQVAIRLMPRNNKAAAKSVDSYDSSTINNNSGYNTMDYFAVRYNK